MKNPNRCNRSFGPTRREFLRFVGFGAGVLALGGCGFPAVGTQKETTSPILPTPAAGHLREYAFEASPLDFELGGQLVQTWGYNGAVPGPEIRVTEGDTLRVNVQNRLPEDTTIHWHGLAVPSAMDGVPGLSQPPIKSGEDFVYEFLVPTAGTY